MSQSWIRVTPRSAPVVERCAGCEGRIVERWDSARRLCAQCALEAELFHRDERRERNAQPA